MKTFVFCIALFLVFVLVVIWACLKASSEPDNYIDAEYEADMLRDAMKEEMW